MSSGNNSTGYDEMVDKKENLIGTWEFDKFIRLLRNINNRIWDSDPLRSRRQRDIEDIF